MANLSFSGHDSFHCRQFWLKKAFDHSSENKPFNDSATLELGVGRNMVTAIRHWGRCFGILAENDSPTEIGAKIFSTADGWDPYLEDEGTLWLLHYLLVAEGRASTFSLIFNELIKLRPELTPEYFISYVNGRGEAGYNENTLKRDFQVFYQTYFADFETSDIEESFTGVLSELNLLKKVQKQVLDVEGVLRKRDVWVVERRVRNEIPLPILFFTLLDKHQSEASIGFEELYNGHNSIGSVFALSKDGLTQVLDALAKEYKKEGVTFSNEAGIREFQMKRAIDPMDILNRYYENRS